MNGNTHFRRYPSCLGQALEDVPVVPGSGVGVGDGVVGDGVGDVGDGVVGDDVGSVGGGVVLAR